MLLFEIYPAFYLLFYLRFRDNKGGKNQQTGGQQRMGNDNVFIAVDEDRKRIGTVLVFILKILTTLSIFVVALFMAVFRSFIIIRCNSIILVSCYFAKY